MWDWEILEERRKYSSPREESRATWFMVWASFRPSLSNIITSFRCALTLALFVLYANHGAQKPQSIGRLQPYWNSYILILRVWCLWVATNARFTIPYTIALIIWTFQYCWVHVFDSQSMDGCFYLVINLTRPVSFSSIPSIWLKLNFLVVQLYARQWVFPRLLLLLIALLLEYHLDRLNLVL